VPSLKTVEARARLVPRRDPYWEALRRGCFLGFRKMTKTSEGTWLARWRDEATGKQHHHPLGDFDHLPPGERRDAAAKEAEEWLKHVDAGGSTGTATVRTACETYVTHLVAQRREASSKDAKKRFDRWVYSDSLARVELSKLQPAHMLAWRKRLSEAPVKGRNEKERQRTEASINRDMSAIRAALNHALDLRLVATDAAWRVSLRPHEAAGNRRETYLDKTQRQKLVAAAADDVAMFLEGLCLLPLRPGALASLNAADFDKKHGTLRIGRDKAGADRKLPLPPAAVALFTKAAKGAKPTDPLLRQASGRRWNKDDWKGPVKDAVKAAKLPRTATAYTLRHSTITDLVVGGLDVMTVAQLSGTSILMIERHYGHLRADHARQALAALAL
jgi:integrase